MFRYQDGCSFRYYVPPWGKFQKNENKITIYFPDKKACVGNINVDTLDVFWVRNYYKELGYDKIEECWWHVLRRSLDSDLRALNSDDELREICFMAENNDGLIDVYFEHVVSSPEILDGNEIFVYVDDDDHNELRVIPNHAYKPIASADETPFSNNYEPTNPGANKPTAFADNTSPPNNTEPRNLGTDNPISQKNEPTTTSNSNPSQATTAKPVSKTPLVFPKTKPKSKANSKPKSNTTSFSKPKANPKCVSKPKPNQHSRRDFKLRHVPAKAFAKSKRKLINDDDVLVVDDVECEVDLSFLQVLVTGDEDLDNALDSGAESNRANSWHSEEMKTPPFKK
ncbi:hypothetical protein Ahy_A02g008560 [Arachis hypogaea]|uniref:PB1-like domain-containing protein n=1 Tax=Arachis hypogaea TaxID=3818 RepID=A0A445EEN4_ARAHY|nr:hypothetical protein Ahy_A02g008560 [Arachis hypogaea]